MTSPKKSVDLKNCLKFLKQSIEGVKNNMGDLTTIGKDDPFAALVSSPLLEKNLSAEEANELRKLWLLEVPNRNEFMRDINSLKQQLTSFLEKSYDVLGIGRVKTPLGETVGDILAKMKSPLLVPKETIVTSGSKQILFLPKKYLCQGHGTMGVTVALHGGGTRVDFYFWNKWSNFPECETFLSKLKTSWSGVTYSHHGDGWMTVSVLVRSNRYDAFLEALKKDIWWAYQTCYKKIKAAAEQV